MPAELSYLIIAFVLLILLMLAGVPGQTRKAGDGSDALRQGWAAAYSAEVAAERAAELEAARDAAGAPPDAALDPPEPQR